MNATASVPTEADGTSGNLTPRVSVAAVFSDLKLGLKVSELQRHLSERLGPAWVLHCSSWRFDSLQQGELLAVAARAADDADLLIVATPADQAVPPAVLAWLQTAMAGGNRRERALIALLGCPLMARKGQMPARDCLKGLARQAGLAFFAHRVEWSDRDAASLLDHLDERARAVTGTLREILSHPTPAPRWGINE